MGGKRILYHEIFKAPPQTLKEAMLRVVPRMDMDKIHTLIYETPLMSDVRKEYLKKVVSIRCEQIILSPYKKVFNQQA